MCLNKLVCDRRSASLAPVTLVGTNVMAGRGGEYRRLVVLAVLRNRQSTMNVFLSAVSNAFKAWLAK